MGWSHMEKSLVHHAAKILGHRTHREDCPLDYDITEAANCMADARKAITELQSELSALKEAARWVPVSERLPVKHRPVLIANSAGLIGHARRRTSRWEIVASNDAVPLFGVTHWMPLPAAPQEATAHE